MATCTTTVISIDGMPAQPAGPPQGRLTLVAATPVMTSDQSGKTTIYYTPYSGALVPIYDGTNLLATPFSEMTNITTNSSAGNAGPAAVTTNSNYDLFVWNNSGTVTLTRGPAWTSDTARGTGAGTTELQRVKGLLTNAVAITNGPDANLGTYVGTVRSDGSSQINWQRGAAAASGTAATLGVWNMYNRVDCRGLIGDTTDSWTYSSATVRAANNSATMRVSFVIGQQEDFFSALYYSMAAVSAGGSARTGIGLDATNAFTGRVVAPGAVANVNYLGAGGTDQQLLGFHFMSACEVGDGSTSTTFYGDNGGTVQFSGLQYQGRF